MKPKNANAGKKRTKMNQKKTVFCLAAVLIHHFIEYQLRNLTRSTSICAFPDDLCLSELQIIIESVNLSAHTTVIGNYDIHLLTLRQKDISASS